MATGEVRFQRIVPARAALRVFSPGSASRASALRKVRRHTPGDFEEFAERKSGGKAEATTVPAAPMSASRYPSANSCW